MHWFRACAHRSRLHSANLSCIQHLLGVARHECVEVCVESGCGCGLWAQDSSESLRLLTTAAEVRTDLNDHVHIGQIDRSVTNLADEQGVHLITQGQNRHRRCRSTGAQAEKDKISGAHTTHSSSTHSTATACAGPHESTSDLGIVLEVMQELQSLGIRRAAQKGRETRQCNATMHFRQLGSADVYYREQIQRTRHGQPLRTIRKSWAY